MPQPATPWAALILNEVAKGPVPFEQLVSKAAPLVPPGRAFRRYLASSNAARKTPLSPAEIESRKSHLIQVGQRHIVIGTINGLKDKGRLIVSADEQRLVTLGRPSTVAPAIRKGL